VCLCAPTSHEIDMAVLVFPFLKHRKTKSTKNVLDRRINLLALERGRDFAPRTSAILDVLSAVF